MNDLQMGLTLCAFSKGDFDGPDDAFYEASDAAHSLLAGSWQRKAKSIVDTIAGRNVVPKALKAQVLFPSTETPSGGLGEPTLSQILGYQLAQARIATYAVFERLVGQPLALRPVEYTILALVNDNPGVSPAQLSQALAVTRPNMTLWIDKLQERRLVRREQNEVDRRGQHLKTTPEGSALAANATQLLQEGEREAFSTLSRVEQLMLAELLHKLAQSRPR